MIRVRFHANPYDPRPVHWPVKHPYWVTGYGGWRRDLYGDEPHYAGYATVVSYADNLGYIYENWPEASHLEATERDAYTFTDRFPRPDWLPVGAPVG